MNGGLVRADFLNIPKGWIMVSARKGAIGDGFHTRLCRIGENPYNCESVSRPIRAGTPVR